MTFVAENTGWSERAILWETPLVRLYRYQDAMSGKSKDGQSLGEQAEFLAALDAMVGAAVGAAASQEVKQ